jgi:carbonic anhydrase
MKTKERILLESKAWLVEKLSRDHDYLRHLKNVPKPNILWIGSSDNLVSIREVTNTEPGELIVHRNIAAQIRSDDMNLMATIEDAIEMGVEFIIVCGSSNCKGITEVIQGNDDSLYRRRWLDELYELYNEHAGELEVLSQAEREKRLCELSIKEQVLKLSELEVVQQAWKKRSSPLLLGWYFDLSSGKIREITSMTAEESVRQVTSVG